MKPHAFVAMPFGNKKNSDGVLIDFNLVYSTYIKPAVEAAGLEVFRADKEQRAGEIREDMFQELLLADMVVVDLSIDNPNVWYELGVRHALRARGVVLVCGGEAPRAFDVYTDRKLRYRMKGDRPDPETLEEDRQSLTDMVTATMESWHGRKISPVYNLMPNLKEPDWKSLRIGSVTEFWEKHEKWEARIALARRDGNIGDILVLAGESPVAAFRAEAWIRAGKELLKVKHFDFALELLEKGLEIEPLNITGLREKGTCMERLALQGKPGYTLERTRSHYEHVLKNYPNDAETWALLGRVEKDAWCASWKREGSPPERMREEATWEDALLKKAIECYREGFCRDPKHYYSGINALTLMNLHQHLAGQEMYTSEMSTLAGAVRFAAQCEKDANQIFWAKGTLGDIEVLLGTPDSVVNAYKEGIATNRSDWFALDSCRQQLQLLQTLGFKPENVDAGIATFDRAIDKIEPPKLRWQPGKVFLFSGHMVDHPDRKVPRFPSEKVPLAAAKIAEALDALAAGPEDLALTQGACGADLLFTEACQARGVNVYWHQPFEEPVFVNKSVVHIDEAWRQRYWDAREKISNGPVAAPDRLGPLPAGVEESYAYERCNLWLLYTALSYGIEKVHFICLWNGEGGDGPGGTGHMYNEVNNRTARVTRINTEEL